MHPPLNQSHNDVLLLNNISLIANPLLTKVLIISGGLCLCTIGIIMQVSLKAAVSMLPRELLSFLAGNVSVLSTYTVSPFIYNYTQYITQASFHDVYMHAHVIMYYCYL